MMRKVMAFVVSFGFVVFCGHQSANAATPTVISQCETITTPGNYVLESNLVSTSPYLCLNIGNGVAGMTSGVNVDCQGYSILGAVALDATSDSSVSNCNLTYPLGNPYPSPGSLIEMLGDTNDTASGNTINGSSLGDGNGADDGIILGNATGDKVLDNNISGTFDTGIESDLFDSHNLIEGNTISDEGYSGIGGWWYNSWLDNTVQDNTISDTPEIFEFDNYCGPASGQTAVYFKGNHFVGNVFTDPKPLFGVGEIIVNSEQAQGCTFTTVPLVTRGNVFTDNNFGTAEHAIALLPARAFKDGGGNICDAMNNPKNYPLVCHSS